MTAVSPFLKAGRAFAFARHMPISKLARRVELDIKRRLRDRLAASRTSGAVDTAPAPAKAESWPAPLFAPRRHLAPVIGAGGTTFCFLHRAVTMPADGGATRIDWSAPGDGPAHQLWRMNLHYMEYLEGLDDGAWPGFVRAWLAENGRPGPGSWRDSWNSYTLSLRVVVWLQELARRSDRLPRDIASQIELAAVAQVRYLVENLETDLGGNHLVKNIKALIWASACYTGEEPARWRALALRLLARELAHQVLAEGMHDERSASYHGQVFADLMECRHALGGDPLDGALDTALQHMAQALADLTHPDGGVALFNDAGLSMAYAPGECLDVYARLFGQRPGPRAVFAYSDAGYFGLRSGGTYLVVDCGRIAPDDLPAHGHGDVLSFELSVAGERIIVDQGVYEYVAGEKRHRARTAASHNTLSLEGADQADFFGAFRCGRRPNVTVRAWQPTENGFVLEGSHDGYAHLPGRPVHVRRFDATAEEVRITDRIEGRTDRAARIGFLLHPEVGVSIEGRHAVLTRGASRVQIAADADLACEPAVWWPDMGLEIATHRLVVAPGASGGAGWVTLFRLATGRGESS